MADDESLLAAIDAAPDADEPRLAHADWLERHGDPERAEFIRLQIEHARSPWLPTDRADELLAANRERWLEGRPSPPGVEWQFERGRPEGLLVKDEVAFLEHWKVLLGRPVGWVTFHGLRWPTNLTSSPVLGRIRRLRLNNTLADDELFREILTSRWLERLDGLALSRADLREPSWSLIGSSPRLAGLRELSLDHDRPYFRPTAADLDALLRSPNLAALRVLDLSGNSFSEDGVAQLADTTLPCRLHRLRLTLTDRRDWRGHPALARAAANPGLTLVLSRWAPADLIAFARGLLGDRLVLE
jgi:uncharacterized protein (TIGR02996 family)